MRKVTYVAVLLLLILICPVMTAIAAEQDNATEPRVLDKAALLSESEEEALTESIESIIEAHNFGVAIVTTNTLNGLQPYQYSEREFDENQYGIGEEADGILFLVSMEDRDWDIDVHGYANTAFNQYARERMAGIVTPLLSDGDYAGAFTKFLELTDLFLAEAATVEPFSDSHPYFSDTDRMMYILGAILISIVISLVTVLVMKGRMKTARPQSLAHEYIQEGSFRLTAQNDMFLYSTVSKTKRAESSGGNTTSRNSSSHSHTSGKF